MNEQHRYSDSCDNVTSPNYVFLSLFTADKFAALCRPGTAFRGITIDGLFLFSMCSEATSSPELRASACRTTCGICVRLGQRCIGCTRGFSLPSLPSKNHFMNLSLVGITCCNLCRTTMLVGSSKITFNSSRDMWFKSSGCEGNAVFVSWTKTTINTNARASKATNAPSNLAWVWLNSPMFLSWLAGPPNWACGTNKVNRAS